MKIIINLIFIFNIVFLSHCNSQPKSAKELWKDYIDNIGDIQLLKKVNTLSYQSITYFQQDSSIEKTLLKFPDKVRYELIRPNGNKEIIIVNDGRGILILNGDTTQLEPENLCRFKSMSLIFPELYYEELGYEFFMGYSEKWAEYTNILVETECGDLVFIFDKKTFDLIGIKPNDYDIHTLILEIEHIQGIPFVTKSINVMNTDTTKTDFNQYQINPDLDDSYFAIE